MPLNILWRRRNATSPHLYPGITTYPKNLGNHFSKNQGDHKGSPLRIVGLNVETSYYGISASYYCVSTEDEIPNNYELCIDYLSILWNCYQNRPWLSNVADAWLPWSVIVLI